MNSNQQLPTVSQDMKRFGELIQLSNKKNLTINQIDSAINEIREIKARVYPQKVA